MKSQKSINAMIVNQKNKNYIIMERNIDAMKYRKSTHLAGVDVEMIIAEKGECILTIKAKMYRLKA